MAFGAGGESIELVRILADRQVREQSDALADRGQGVERTHRHVDLVSDATDINQHARRMFGGKRAGDPADHVAPRSRRSPSERHAARERWPRAPALRLAPAICSGPAPWA